jgi:DNA-binding MarR family transcriptional regulator
MKARGSFSLAHHLPHLLRRAHFDSDARFTALYGTAVTSRQLALLTVVERLPGASQSEVAAEIGLDLNTCSDLVVRTVAKGLLRRERSPTDGRSFCLYLSDAGQATAREGIAKAAQFEAEVARRLTAAERDQLKRLLRKLIGFD